MCEIHWIYIYIFIYTSITPMFSKGRFSAEIPRRYWRYVVSPSQRVTGYNLHGVPVPMDLMSFCKSIIAYHSQLGHCRFPAGTSGSVFLSASRRPISEQGFWNTKQTWRILCYTCCKTFCNAINIQIHITWSPNEENVLNLAVINYKFSWAMDL